MRYYLVINSYVIILCQDMMSSKSRIYILTISTLPQALNNHAFHDVRHLQGFVSPLRSLPLLIFLISRLFWRFLFRPWVSFLKGAAAPTWSVHFISIVHLLPFFLFSFAVNQHSVDHLGLHV